MTEQSLKEKVWEIVCNDDHIGFKGDCKDCERNKKKYDKLLHLILSEKNDLINKIKTNHRPNWSDHNSYTDNLEARFNSELQDVLSQLTKEEME